jgi:hypothetical protein
MSSFLGMIDKTVVVEASSTVNVILKKLLDEVVVVALVSKRLSRSLGLL